MSLDKLPAEMIVANLDTQFFRKDTKRMALFRAWYPFAAKQIRTHVISGNRAIVLASEGYLWPPVSVWPVLGENVVPAWTVGGVRELTLDLSHWDPRSSAGAAAVSQGKEPMNKVLERLVKRQGISAFDMVSHPKKLHTLRLRLGKGDSSPEGMTHGSPLAWFAAAPVMVHQIARIPESSFTCLELNFRETGSFYKDPREEGHMCSRLNLVLMRQPQLKEFRVGLWSVCHWLLDKAHPKEKTSSLEALLVHCVMGDDQLDSGVCNVFWNSDDWSRRIRDQTPGDLALASEKWVRAMKEPRMVKIIWRDHRSAWARRNFSCDEDCRSRNLIGDSLTGELRSFGLEENLESEGRPVSVKVPPIKKRWPDPCKEGTCDCFNGLPGDPNTEWRRYYRRPDHGRRPVIKLTNAAA